MHCHFSILETHSLQIKHGTTSRQFGSLNDHEPAFSDNISRLMNDMKLSRPVYLNQVHGDTIMEINSCPLMPPKADALITREKNLPLMIKTADCQAVLMFDPITELIAAVHSGWRGSIQNIIGKTIQKLKKMGVDPQNLLIGISPSLGPECSEFSDPDKELPDWTKPYRTGNTVDFWRISEDQCLAEGVAKENIENARICTKCDPNYFSYRNGDEGRMATFISLI